MAQAYLIEGTKEYNYKKGLIFSSDSKNALKGFLLQEKIEYSKIKKTKEEASNFKVRKEVDFLKKEIDFFKIQ